MVRRNIHYTDAAVVLLTSIHTYSYTHTYMHALHHIIFLTGKSGLCLMNPLGTVETLLLAGISVNIHTYIHT